jgi:putative chitinase
MGGVQRDKVIDPRLLVLTGDADLWRAPLSETCALYEIDTAPRQVIFMAQAAHESAGFTQLRESLHYSAAALLSQWPRRFTVDAARAMAFDQRAIAERAYGGRMGNGPEGSGDGWKFIGRGLFQVTGRANYRAIGRALAIDAEGNPEMLEIPHWAALSAGEYWSSRGCNELADNDDFETITRAINGGVTGMAERVNWLNKALECFD